MTLSDCLLLPVLCGALAGSAAAPKPFEAQGKWGYRDAKGKVVIPARYEAAQPFLPEGIAAVADKNGWAYIDAQGRVVIRPFLFDNGPDYFREGLARFVTGGEFGFFDRRGKVIIPARFSFALPFSEGLAAVCADCKEVPEGEHKAMRGGKWGYINRQGALVIPAQFEEAGSFEKGRARVKLGGQWRSINPRGILQRD